MRTILAAIVGVLIWCWLALLCVVCHWVRPWEPLTIQFFVFMVGITLPFLVGVAIAIEREEARPSKQNAISQADQERIVELLKNHKPDGLSGKAIVKALGLKVKPSRLRLEVMARNVKGVSIIPHTNPAQYVAE